MGAAFPTAILGSWHDEAVGPHTVSMYQVAFAVDEFPRLVPWLMLNHAGLDVLIHPQTADSYDDHMVHALWLGEKLPPNAGRLRPSPPRRTKTAEPRRPAPLVLDAAGQQQDEQDDDDEAGAAARVIAPAAAVRPGRQRADQDQDQNDQKDGAHRVHRGIADECSYKPEAATPGSVGARLPPLTADPTRGRQAASTSSAPARNRRGRHPTA